MWRKFFHAAAVLLPAVAMAFVASCSDSDNENNEPVIKLTGGTTDEQIVYADETQKPDNITFKAPAAWTATVAELQTKAEAGRVDWLELSAYSGNAGEMSLTMTLKVNTTGQDRKSEIRIVCGDTTLTITVEQKATKQNGELPDEAKPEEPSDPDNPEKPNTQNLKNRIVKIESVEWDAEHPEQKGSETATATFTYDDKGRLTKVNEVYKYPDISSSNEPIISTTVHTTTIAYGEGTVSYELTDHDDGKWDYTVIGSVVLDENGRAVSGQRTSFDSEEGDSGKEDWKESYKLSYDADSYLIQSVRTLATDVSEDSYYYRSTWTDGNQTQVDWKIVDTPAIDKATYSSVPNTANLDLNWLCIFETEGFEMSAGDSGLAILGYTGNRSKQLVESITCSSGDGYRKDYDVKCVYELDSEGRVSKITKTESHIISDGHEYRYFTEDRITYAE